MKLMGLPKKRLIVDTNVFIAAFKSGYTATRLLLKILLDPEIELVADDILLNEYKKWFNQLSSILPSIRKQAGTLYRLIEARVNIVEPGEEDIEMVKKPTRRKTSMQTYTMPRPA